MPDITTQDAKPQLQHVHVGTGALGLGLVAWIGAKAGLSVILANRSEGSSRDSITRNRTLRQSGRYEVAFPSSANTESVEFDRFLFTDEDRDAFIEAVSDSRTVLLTTAVKTGFEEVVASLSTAIAARIVRDPERPLFLVACENGITAATFRDAVRTQLGDRIDTQTFDRLLIFVPCVVDRLCQTPALAATGNVRVEVEAFAEWILELPKASFLANIIRTPQTADCINLVTNVEPLRRRKRWLINGPHLLISLHALVVDYDRLDLYLQRETHAREVLEILLDEALDVFLSVEPGLERADLLEFNSRTLERFMSYPDSIARVLGRFSGPDHLHEFVRDLYGKVSDPCLQSVNTRQDGGLPFMTSYTLWLLTQLVSDGHYITRRGG